MKVALAVLAKIAMTFVMMMVLSGVIAYLHWVWQLWTGEA
jgi:hypothetical protein